jgi:hypothetical protein
MTVLFFVLLLLALICFAAAASGKVASKYNLVALGLALWVAVPFIETLTKL